TEIPALRAASRRLVPAGTSISCFSLTKTTFGMELPPSADRAIGFRTPPRRRGGCAGNCRDRVKQQTGYNIRSPLSAVRFPLLYSAESGRRRAESGEARNLFMDHGQAYTELLRRV